MPDDEEEQGLKGEFKGEAAATWFMPEDADRGDDRGDEDKDKPEVDDSGA